MDISSVGLENILVKMSDFELIGKELFELKQSLQEIGGQDKKRTREINDLHNKCLTLEDKNKELEIRLEAMDRHSRRLNLLFYNVPERDGETSEETRDIVTSVVRNDIGLQTFGRECVKRAYRIGGGPVGGRGDSRGSRPVFVVLAEYCWKREILGSLVMLKGTGIGVQEDYTYKVRDVRRQLKLYLADAKAFGCTAHLRKDKLVVDGRSYSLKDVQQSDGQWFTSPEHSSGTLNRNIDSVKCFCPEQNSTPEDKQKPELHSSVKEKIKVFEKKSHVHLVHNDKTSDSPQTMDDDECVLHIYKGTMVDWMGKQNDKTASPKTPTC